MKREILLSAVLISFLLTIPVASAQEGPDFEIDTVNGEEADQINEVEIGERNGIEVGLNNADHEHAKFMAYLDGQEMFMGEDEEITIKPEYEISEGEHELRIERQSRREENVSRTTKVQVTKKDPDKTSGTVDFKIDKIAGQDSDQVNDIEVEVGERINIGLEGADFEESRFTAHIDGTEMHVDKDGLVMVSDIKKVGAGQHELELEYYHADGTSKASTQINIVDIKDRENRETSRSEPKDFEIESINGEDADQVNELKLSEGEPVKAELNGVDLGETRLKAFIDGAELPVNDEGIMMTSKINDIDEGKHKLRIATIFEGEVSTDAETEVEITEVETRRERQDRRQPEELDSEHYDEDFDPDVDGIEVERGNGKITVTMKEEALNDDGGEVVVGDSIEDITKLQMNFKRGIGGHGSAARLTIEEKDPGAVKNSDVEIYSVLELTGKNLEILAPDIRYAVKNKWADKHGFDEAIRERGGGRQNTELGFYDVEDNWKRFDTSLRDTTPTHSIYSLNPRRIDQDFSLESNKNTLAIGGKPEGGIIYAEGPQSQCESFKSSEDVPSGWKEIDKTCAELDQIQRERDQLRNRINNLKEDLQNSEDRGEKEDVEKLNDALDELDRGNIDEAEKMYEDVQDKTAKSFLRNFIIKTVKDVFPF